jgi:hypothetical protein
MVGTIWGADGKIETDTDYSSNKLGKITQDADDASK